VLQLRSEETYKGTGGGAEEREEIREKKLSPTLIVRQGKIKLKSSRRRKKKEETRPSLVTKKGLKLLLSVLLYLVEKLKK